MEQSRHGIVDSSQLGLEIVSLLRVCFPSDNVLNKSNKRDEY